MWENVRRKLEKEKFFTSPTKHDHKKNPGLSIGDTIVIAGITWRKFKEDEKGNSYMLADDITEKAVFGDTNDWKDSPIREKLKTIAEQIEKEIGKRIISIEVDLLSLDGLRDYGTCVDKVSILTYDLYRNNRSTIKPCDEWWWLCTPSSAPSGVTKDTDMLHRYSYRNVEYVGTLGIGYDTRYARKGVRPFFILKAK